jgi:stringent starvation protein B
MTSAKPYLIRAIYEWLADNDCTPYIAVDTTFSRVSVPEEYIKDNAIVLNISSLSTQHLLVNNEALTCSARFNGVARQIYVPIAAITAIYAAENGQGMTFPPEEESEFESEETTIAKGEKPQLKVITGGED